MLVVDSHCLFSKNFIKEALDVFKQNPYIHLLSPATVCYIDENHLTGTTTNVLPINLELFLGGQPFTLKTESNNLLQNLNKPEIRYSLDGYCYFITKYLFNKVGDINEIGGYGFDDRALGLAAYLTGYKVWGSNKIQCLHKWNKEKNKNPWTQKTRKTKNFEYKINLVFDSLSLGYIFLPKTYFQTYFIPQIKIVAKDNFNHNYKAFQKDINKLDNYKKRFWQNAVRSVEDYWLEYWDTIYSKMTIDQKIHLCKDFDCPELNSEMIQKEIQELEQKKEEEKDSHKNLVGGNIKTISPEWIKWIKDSLNSGVSFIKILELMLKNSFDEEFAINEIRKEQKIDTERQTLDLDDLLKAHKNNLPK
jgi:GT2 family glycosyltransferase